MKNLITVVGSATALLLLQTSLIVNAQNIEYSSLKTDVALIDSPLEKINLLEPIKYNYTKDDLSHLKLPSGIQYGFKVLSAQENLPASTVKTDRKKYNSGKNSTKQTSYKKVDNQSLVPLLVAAIQEQQKLIDQLQVQIKALSVGK